MLQRKNVRQPAVLAMLILLSGCATAAVDVRGAGCDAYLEEFNSIPFGALELSKPEFVQWFNGLDIRMVEVCRR